MIGCEWLPDLLEYDSTYPNLDYYDADVYNIFKEDFINTQPLFQGKKVCIRTNPLVNGKEQTYFHITSKDYDYSNNRTLDIERCKRIHWVKALIEHYDCNKHYCHDCNGIKTWSAVQKGKQIRIKILFEEVNYIVILEKRPTYYLIITAYYIDKPHTLKKLLNEFNKAKSAPTGTLSGTPSTL